MRVFLVPLVAKLIRKDGLPGIAICQTAREVIAGTLGSGEANLGSGLFKKRVARPGGGKSGGYRVIVACRPPRADRILFIYAFAKNAAANLTPPGREALAKVAERFLAANDQQVSALCALGEIIEVDCDVDG
jgi:hypothetical protein